MRKVVRVGLPALCAVVGLSLLPAASASAATTTASCTRTALLLPGISTSCGTPVVACPKPTAGANTCFYSAKGAAAAAVGIAVGGRAVSNATATFVPNEGSPFTASATAAANCTAGLAILGGCSGQTDNKHDAAQEQGFAGAGNVAGTPGLFSSGAQGVCVWTGGPIAVLATLTCTEEVDSSLVNAG